MKIIRPDTSVTVKSKSVKRQFLIEFKKDLQNATSEQMMNRKLICRLADFCYGKAFQKVARKNH